MEDLLDQLCKESISSKNTSIKEGCLQAKELLESQSKLMHCPPSDLRVTCLKPLQAALETKQSRLVSLALSGFQKLLRDNQFYSDYEDPDESTWLPCQLLTAIQTLPSYHEDVQVELLKVLLSMSCIPNVALSGHVVVHILGVCGSAYGRGTPAMKSASQSAASQSIMTFLNQIIIESEEQEKEAEKRQYVTVSEEEEEQDVYDFIAPAFDDLVPVINYIAEKLTEANKHRENKKEVEIPALFLLECTNSLLAGLSTSNSYVASQRVTKNKSAWQPPAYCSTLLVSALWQRLCPALIALLGTPVSMRVSRGSGRTQGQMGRGSGTASMPSSFFNSQEAKAIYSVACNLVVALGAVGEMRPVLESLFHRMLLYPPPSCRQDALRAVSEILKSPLKLIQLAGPILHSDPRNRYQCDIALFRLTMDSLIECSNLSEASMQMTVIDSVAGVLSSLEELCEGGSLSLFHTTAINDAFPRLEDVDYMGPLTYENHHLSVVTYEGYDSLTSDADSELPDSFSQFSHDDKEDQGESEEEEQQQREGDETEKEEKERKEKRVHGEENIVVEEKGSKEDYDVKGDAASKENSKMQESESDPVSESSGETEGPVDESFICEQQMLAEEEEQRLLRLLESLGPKADGAVTLKDEEQQREISNAQHFCVTLQALLPSLLAIRSTIEVDEAVLEFSSKYCQGVFSHTSDNRGCPIIINADGIYLTTYAALSLNLKLIQSGIYCQGDEAVLPMTQDQFVENVFGSGVLVYLSSSWVGEVYNQVVKDSFLQRAGYNPQSPSNCALVNLLTDLDGLGSVEKGSQMLSDHRRLERAAFNVPKSASKDAGYKLCRRILTCCWESILSILGTLLKHLEGEGGILAPIRLLLMGENSRKDEARREQDTLILCLNSLQSTARLANILGLQKRCGVVFSLLSSACFPKDERNPLMTPCRNRFRSPSFPKRPLKKLHKAHVLSFHVMMSAGLELGSHAPDCWSHLFRCCLYLAELERKFFSTSGPIIPFGGFTPGSMIGSTKKEARWSAASDEFCSDDLYAHISSTPEVTSLTIEELVSECHEGASNSGFLSTNLSGKSLCCLTLLVDKFFDHASAQLNLNALISFLKELCKASQNQLFSRVNPCTPKKGLLTWSKLKKGQSPSRVSEATVVEESLLLHCLGEVMLKVVRSGRPLIHIMKAWAVSGPHFLEAACHKDVVVSKKAVCCIHDVVNSLLASQTELPHFHFNEALFKPFENLLCLELCDIEVQDQIVSSICEFVESCNSEIKSGWRPLFGALRSVRTMPLTSPSNYPPTKGVCHESVSHLRAVKDVFEAFLSTDNVLVFANAALDCILCLLKHVKGSGGGEPVTETVVCWGELVGGDLCLDALRYIHRCAAILASMYVMPASPVFHAAHRLNFSSSRHLVDCNIPGIDETRFWTLIEETLNCGNEKVDYSSLWPEEVDGGGICLPSLDEGSGVLQVWYVLLEGLAGAVITCPRRHQPQVLDTLFSLMRALPDCPGPSFGLYCINHLLLPMMQEWIRRSNSAHNTDWECTQSFKQYAGLTSDLVVDYLQRSCSDENLENDAARRLMLQQCLIVLVECVSCSSEVISRLGCSCIRHIAISCGDKLHSSLWDILVRSLHRASQISLFPVYQLMHMFCPESPNFYGDIGQVKVAARRDCTGQDTDRLRQISHQVFLLDSQRHELTSVEENPDAEDRSFIFLLYPASTSSEKGAGEEVVPYRVPFRSLVVGLLANQMILQTLGQILVEGSPHMVPSLANVLLQTSDFSRCSSLSEGVGEIKGHLPGMLKCLTHSQILVLLDSLKMSYETSIQFDRRPGLKFLIQKVAQSERAANLYKQAGASWTLRMLTLFDLILSRVKHGLNLESVKAMLDSERLKKDLVVSETDVESETSCARGPQRPSALLEGDTHRYIQMLSLTFTELCKSYLELVDSRADNKGSALDFIDDQPIFFLTIPADDFPTTHRRNLEKWTKSLEEFNKEYMNVRGGGKGERSDEVSEGKDETRMEISPSIEYPSSSLPSKMTLGASLPHCESNEEVNEETLSQGEKKPFSFADLAQALNSDDDDDDEDDNASTCTNEGDSGVASGFGVEQSVYSIATEREISSLMGDYRRRKNRHSLPSQFVQKRVNPFIAGSLPSQHQQSFRPSESVPLEIEEQRSKSLMKDSEAHLKVWTEMIVTVFDLISQMKDSELRPLLPLVFPTMRSLTAHAHDPHLRQVVAEMLNRVACLYGFSPSE